MSGNAETMDRARAVSLATREHHAAVRAVLPPEPAMTATEAWRALLDADQAVLALPRTRRKRSPEALTAAEARIDFVLALQARRYR